LPTPLVVQVLDAQNNPVPNRAVTWVIGAGGGSANPQNSTTDADGKATTQWTVGAQGNNTLNAVVSGVGTATFSATATAGSPSPSKSTVTASPRSITAGTSSTITVRVRDASNNPVRGVPVTISGSGTGNTVDPATDTSDDNGVATFAFSSSVAEVKIITAVAAGVTLDQKPTVTVVKALSRTRIISHDPNPSDPGQVVHVVWSVTSGEAGGTPTGMVTVISNRESGGAATCTADVSAGACDITLTAAGSHTLFANYSGDARFEDSADDDTHEVRNLPPVANADAYSTPTGVPLSVPAATGVLVNDTDPNNDALTAHVANPPSQGGLILNSDGSFTYSPNLGATGSDSFTYTASGGSQSSSPATVTITFQ
jgi:hypothetical protein